MAAAGCCANWPMAVAAAARWGCAVSTTSRCCCCRRRCCWWCSSRFDASAHAPELRWAAGAELRGADRLCQPVPVRGLARAGHRPAGVSAGGAAPAILDLVRCADPGRRAVLLATLAGALLSLAMEFLQIYLPRRVPSNLDLALNAAGALAGASI